MKRNNEEQYLIKKKFYFCVILLMVVFSRPVLSAENFKYEPQPDKAVIMFVHAHPDDEQFQFGGTMTHYAMNLKVPVIGVLMTNGDDGGDPIIREIETRNAYLATGMRNEPVMLNFDDCAGWTDEGTDGVALNWRNWGGQDYVIGVVTELIRRHKPDIILAHSRNSYPNHQLSSEVATAAFKAAGDPTQYPEQIAKGLKAWQPKKLYERGMWVNAFTHSWTMKVPDGRTVQEAQSTSLQYHVSQGMSGSWGASSSPFGLTESIVGADNGATNFLQNITLPSAKKALQYIEAENFDSQSGIQTEICTDITGGLNITSIENGDNAVYENIDFSNGVDGFDAIVASSSSGGTIEIRLDETLGPLIGTCEVTNTGGTQSWAVQSCNVIETSGFHDVYLIFKGGSGNLFNIDCFKFSKDIVEIPQATKTYEAESGTVNGATVTSHSNASGGQAVGDFNSIGAFSQVNNVDGGTEGGLFKLKMRYSAARGMQSGQSKAFLRMSLYINDLHHHDVSFWSDAGFSTFVDSYELPIRLNAGTKNTIKLVYDNSYDVPFIQLDAFYVTGVYAAMSPVIQRPQNPALTSELFGEYSINVLGKRIELGASRGRAAGAYIKISNSSGPRVIINVEKSK